MSRKTATRIRCAGALTLVLALSLALSAAASAGERTYTALERHGAATFKLDRLPPLAVRAARLEVSRRRYPVGLARVREGVRRGQLRLRVPRRPPEARPSRSPRRVRLVLVIGRAPAPGPRPAGQDGGTRDTGSCSSAAAPFSSSNIPGACWRPYSDESPFNQPIPRNARTASNSAAIVRRVVGFGQPQNLVSGTADRDDDWGHPTYYSRPGDPVFRLHCTESWGRCSIEGHQIRVPDAARPAGGGDAHMTIVDQQSGWEYDLWTVQSKPRGGGTLSFKWGGRTRIDGDGLNSDATAARYGNLAGIIRAPELEAGEIDHALFMVVRCDSGRYVYPAKKTGRACSDTDNAPPMGTRFQLDMSDAEINSLPVPRWKKAILRAMARYGLYFGDTGSGSWTIQFESGSTYTSFGQRDRLDAFAQRNGLPTWDGRHIFNMRDGVDWQRRLKVIHPCVAQRSC